MAELAKDKIVEALYGVLANPEDFDVFVQDLAGAYTTLIAGLPENSEVRAESKITEALKDIEAEFETVARIFDRFRFQPLAKNPETPMAEPDGLPSIDVNAKGIIIAANSAARQMLGVSVNGTLDMIAVDGDVASALSQNLKAICSKQSEDIFVTLPAYDSNNRSRIFLLMSPVRDEAKDARARLQALSLSWRKEVAEPIAGTFRLTPAEQDILRSIVTGSSLRDFAEARGKSLATVRTQAKTLLQKTGAGSQIELVRIFAALSLAIPQAPLHAANDSGAPSAVQTSLLSPAPGRTMQVDMLGPENGHPIIMLHGLVTGTALPPDAVDALYRNDLRLISPWRPGFSGSSASTKPFDLLPEAHADDIGWLMNQLGLKQAVLAGHFSGALYAASAAQKLGARVAGIVAISGTVPIRDRRQLDDISLWQKMFAYSARYFPAALPILARGALELMANGRIDKLLAGLYAKPHQDAACVAQPEIRDVLMQSFENTFIQGTRAYEHDARLTARDWSAWLNAIHAPVLYIHGESDPVTALNQVTDLPGFHRHVRVEKIPDAGQLIAFSKPEAVFACVASFARSCQTSAVA